MASLQVCLRGFRSELSRLRAIHVSISHLSPQHRYPIAELILLRFFDSFEQLVSQTAFRLACGAKYLDGTQPTLLARANSLEQARFLMLTNGRIRAKTSLEWSKASMIVESVNKVIDPSDHFVLYSQSHGVPINQLRVVRNVIAHRSTNAKTQYCEIILRPQYGSDLYIRPGMYLLTQRFSPSPLETLFATGEIMAKEYVRE